MRRLARFLPAALAAALVGTAAGARPAAAQARPAANTAGSAVASAPRENPFTPAGRYALLITFDDAYSAPFTVVVRDSAGRWGGEFIGTGGRRRPLLAVVPRPDSSQLIVQYAEGSGFATVLLRVRGDSVRGAAENAGGTFLIRGTRSPLAAAPSASPRP